MNTERIKTPIGKGRSTRFSKRVQRTVEKVCEDPVKIAEWLFGCKLNRKQAARLRELWNDPDLQFDYCTGKNQIQSQLLQQIMKARAKTLNTDY